MPSSEHTAHAHHAHHHEDHRADEHSGHGEHAGHDPRAFRDRFWISLLLTIPTLIWGSMLQHALGFHAPQFPGSQWMAPLFGTLVFVYGGRVFLLGAGSELRAKQPGMMTLIALAISVAFAYSFATLLGARGMPLWEELATLVTIMLLGHWIEMRSVAQAKGALAALSKLLPSTAVRLRDGTPEEVPITDLREGDRVLVRPGARVPADGVIARGASALDESMLTGESRPLDKQEGDAVVAGTVNGSGSLHVEITGTGERTRLAGILRLVAEAQSSRSRAQDLADRAAFALTLVALGAGVVTMIVWLAFGQALPYAVERTVTVLVIACPHALGLAIPLVIAISTTLGARSGLLVRDRRGLERSRELDVVVFDKTGTLTRGELGVVNVRAAEGVEEDLLLALAAAVEADSEHPIARAIVDHAKERGVSIRGASGVRAIPGVGVEASVEGRSLAAGGPALLRMREVTLDRSLAEVIEAASARGQASIVLLEGTRALGVIAVADVIRPESRDAIVELRAMGIEVAMLTGDARPVADAVARELGIHEVHAEVLPDRKAEVIEGIQARGAKVAMVGDGVNDAPALLRADVGIAIGAGTDVAVEAGDVVLVRNDPRDVARIVKLSRASYRKMVQNLFWATGYNVIAIPLAAGVLAGAGIVLSPAAGAVLMSLSTVIVALNAQLLRRADLG